MVPVQKQTGRAMLERRLEEALNASVSNISLVVVEMLVLASLAQYLLEYAAKHFAEDGWLLGAFASLATFALALVGTFAAIGCLPYWRTPEGRRAALRFSIGRLRSLLLFTRLLDFLPRAIAGFFTAGWVWLNMLRAPWVDLIESSYVNLFFVSMNTYFIAEMVLLWLKFFGPIQSAYIFTQEKRIKKAQACLSRPSNLTPRL